MHGKISNEQEILSTCLIIINRESGLNGKISKRDLAVLTDFRVKTDRWRFVSCLLYGYLFLLEVRNRPEDNALKLAN